MCCHNSFLVLFVGLRVCFFVASCLFSFVFVCVAAVAIVAVVAVVAAAVTVVAVVTNDNNDDNNNNNYYYNHVCCLSAATHMKLHTWLLLFLSLSLLLLSLQ